MGKGKKSKRSRRNSKHERDAEAGGGGAGGVPGVVSSPLMLVFFGLEIVFGFVYIIIGSLNVYKCNIEPMIPIWLILMGVTYLVSGIHESIQYQLSRTKKSRHIVATATSALLTLLTVAFFIAGNVWVYTAWGVSPDYGHYWFSNGCDQGAYFLAFVGIIIMDILFGLIILGVIFYAIYAIFSK